MTVDCRHRAILLPGRPDSAAKFKMATCNRLRSSAESGPQFPFTTLGVGLAVEVAEVVPAAYPGRPVGELVQRGQAANLHALSPHGHHHEPCQYGDHGCREVGVVKCADECVCGQHSCVYGIVLAPRKDHHPERNR